jgi:hypothetical protein
VKKTRQNKKLEPPFRFNRNGKGSSSENMQFIIAGACEGWLDPWMPATSAGMTSHEQ